MVWLSFLNLHNNMLTNGEPPMSWRKTFFSMLANKTQAVLTSDLRPIATGKLFYECFGYMFVGRMEKCLDQNQPEEQHGIESGRHIEKNICGQRKCSLIKCCNAKPRRGITLDISKVSDRVHWGALWRSLRAHGVLEHLIRIFQTLYHEQARQLFDHWTASDVFPYFPCATRVCVESPALLCSFTTGPWELGKMTFAGKELIWVMVWGISWI